MAVIDFFTSPTGLGHATRDAAVARNLRDREIRFVTGCAAASMLEQEGHDVRDLYDPPPMSVRGGSLRHPALWLWRYLRYYRRCKGVAEGVIYEDAPGAVVSDEDFASLAVAQGEGVPTVLITDILGTRFTRGIASVIERRMNGAMRRIIESCDAVIMPEDGPDEGNIRRVGPIVREPSLPRDELRAAFAFEAPTVLVCVGGTDAGGFLIERALESVPRFGDADVVVAAGPAIPRRFEGVRNLGYVENLHEAVMAADVLVSLAGRSTIDEARAYGTPAVFIPIRGHFEQEDNARAEGFAFDDIARLGELVSEKLAEPRRPSHTDGARTAAGIIRDAALKG